MKHRWITALAAATLLGAAGASAASAGSQAPNAAGSGTAFPFSGTLVQPNGNDDFQFQVYDSLTAGTSIAGPVIVASVMVIASKYSTRIDFGSNPFTGAARFLKISWRKTGTTTFTPLTPRVELVAVPYALGLRLPLSESTSSSGNAFGVANTGSGAGLTGSAASGYGVTGSSSSGFAGIYGISGQNGIYGDTSSAIASGVYGHNSGSGNGVAGISSNGGFGTIGLGSSTSFAGTYGSSGHNGLYGETSSTTDSGVYGHDSSSGYGVTGFSDSGIGGYFRGGGGSNPAIKLENGGIQVSGAGTDTPTPVFTHVVTNANMCNSSSATILDNPLLNNHPDAFVFIQSYQYLVATATNYIFSSVGTDCPVGHWVVNNANNAWYVGDTFSVLVINP
jgi:hypothetical protein